MIVEVSQNEQNENGSVDMFAKEIELWKDFRYALYLYRLLTYSTGYQHNLRLLPSLCSDIQSLLL